MEKKETRGRKPLPERERLGAGFRVPFLDAELVLIDKAAASASRARAQWARLGLLKLAKEKWKP